jgi:hypothetical protein
MTHIGRNRVGNVRFESLQFTFLLRLVDDAVVRLTRTRPHTVTARIILYTQTHLNTHTHTQCTYHNLTLFARLTRHFRLLEYVRFGTAFDKIRKSAKH